MVPNQPNKNFEAVIIKLHHFVYPSLLFSYKYDYYLFKTATIIIINITLDKYMNVSVLLRIVKRWSYYVWQTLPSLLGSHEVVFSFLKLVFDGTYLL